MEFDNLKLDSDLQSLTGFDMATNSIECIRNVITFKSSFGWLTQSEKIKLIESISNFYKLKS